MRVALVFGWTDTCTLLLTVVSFGISEAHIALISIFGTPFGRQSSNERQLHDQGHYITARVRQCLSRTAEKVSQPEHFGLLSKLL